MATHRPITVGAACESQASVSLRLAHNDEPHQGAGQHCEVSWDGAFGSL
jgi:hypothetical protein